MTSASASLIPALICSGAPACCGYSHGTWKTASASASTFSKAPATEPSTSVPRNASA
ncbi:hypothetical protein ACRAVF_26590 [Bradyrhizobium oligotrophicum S58]